MEAVPAKATAELLDWRLAMTYREPHVKMSWRLRARATDREGAQLTRPAASPRTRCLRGRHGVRTTCEQSVGQTRPRTGHFSASGPVRLRVFRCLLETSVPAVPSQDREWSGGVDCSSPSEGLSGHMKPLQKPLFLLRIETL